MTKSLETLKADAKALHQQLYGLSQEAAILVIVSAFIHQIEDTQRDVMDSVEAKLLPQGKR